MAMNSAFLPSFLAEPSRLGEEISVTGKWVPLKNSGWFGKSADSKEMLARLDEIQALAVADLGVLSAEVNNEVGGDAVLIHQVFKDASAVVSYYSTTAARIWDALRVIARPDMHIVRGMSVPPEARDAISASEVPVVLGEYIYGYVKHDYRRPSLETAINVTAKWTCKPGATSHLDALRGWWQRVGTDAHSMEEGLLRYEAYQVVGEDALIIHETFVDTTELKFHLTKGTAKKYKKDIDQVAVLDRYFFRGPVSWLIRTYSRFLRLPATYSTLAAYHATAGGSMSEGTTE